MNLGLEEVGLDYPEQTYRDMYFQQNRPAQHHVLQLLPYHSISPNPFDFHSMTDIATGKVDSISQISLAFRFALACCWRLEHRHYYFHMHSTE